MKNIHVLKTDKPSRLHFTEFEEELVFTPKYEKLDGVNIYITSDEEIKEGDWFLCLDNGKCNDSIYKANEAWLNMEEKQPSYCKKIILTTDQDLIKDGVQAIDEEFLEWFVKNPSCERVDVMTDAFTVKEMSMLPIGTRNLKYKIIIPKECMITKIMQMDAKMAYDSLPKQETLEEAAERLAKHFNIDFIEGAKWQQERMYSEEDMKTAFKIGFSIGYGSDVHAIDEKNRTCDEWFEQFKKK